VKRRSRTGGNNPHQLKIAWASPGHAITAMEAETLPPANVTLEQTTLPSHSKMVRTHESPPIQRLPWDFRESFPQPTEEAIEAGVISEDDCNPDNVRYLHEEHARQALSALRALDIVFDARRRGVDPGTGKPPRTHAAQARLRKYLDEEPNRLEQSFTTMLGVYEEAFGTEASDAFTKAIRAWHAGIDVVADIRKPVVEPVSPSGPKRRHISSCLPVSRALCSAVKAGTFGQNERGPICPSQMEVRAITEQHADKLIEMLDSSDDEHFRNGLAQYAEDFGQKAANQLEAYARREHRDRSR
jgi:hypothetical protein